MSKIYHQWAARRNEHVGRSMAENGRVYRERSGMDEYMGCIEYQEGKIHPDTDECKSKDDKQDA